MTTATTSQIESLVKGYKGAVHGNTRNNEWDIEFPNAIEAMAFAQTIEYMKNDEDSKGLDFWVMCLCVRIREGDSITDIHSPVVLTVW